jgi:hypothetical protein
MTRHILSVRINRRAIGAAVLSGDALTLADGRHLTSARHRAVPAATRYITRLLEQSGALTVVVDAPTPLKGTTTQHLLDAITDLLASRGVTPLVVAKADVMAAYGLSPVPTRGQVRDVVINFWPDLSTITGRIQPYAADAAAAALYAECRLALSPPPT